MLLGPKKKKLEPLTDNDIMLAIIRNEKSIDLTEEYRLWLVTLKNLVGIARMPVNGRNGQEKAAKPKIDVDGLGLPIGMLIDQPAETIIEDQIAQLQKQTVDMALSEQQKQYNSRIRQYEALLNKVLHLHSLSQESYQVEVVQGTNELNSLSKKVEEVTVVVTEARKHHQKLIADLRQRALQIVRKVQREKRIKQVLETVNIWRESLLDNMKYFNEQKLLEFGAQKVLEIIKSTKDRFKKNSTNYSDYDCFGRIQNFLDGKQKSITQKLTDLMDSAIIEFNSHNYGSIFLNYQQMTKILKIPNKMQNLPLVLDGHLNKIMKRGLKGIVTSFEKLEASSSAQYLQYFQQLLPSLQTYLHNWHLTTRWHIQYRSADQELQKGIRDIGQELLRFRKTIWTKTEEKVADLLAKSHRFFTLSLNQRAELMLKLYDFVAAGNFFANHPGKMIAKIIKQKLRQENDLYGKHVMALIKFCLNKELRVNIYEELLPSLILDESYICIPTKEELTRLEQLVEGTVPNNYQPERQPPTTEDIELILQHDRSHSFQKNTSSYYIQKATLQFGRRAYLQPSMHYEIFVKIREMVQMLLFFIWRFVPSDIFKKQLLEEWGNLGDIKLSEYKDIEAYQEKLQYFMECANKQKKFNLLKKQVSRLMNRWDISQYATLKKNQLTISHIVAVLENSRSIATWLKLSIRGIFPNGKADDVQKMENDCLELGNLAVELVQFTYDIYIEEMKSKYATILLLMPELKWDIKKYNSDNAHLYREYKTRFFQVIQGQILALRELKCQQAVNQRVEAAMVDVFFQCLLEGYQRIDKVNENGRQLMRLDSIELGKMIESLGTSTTNSYKQHLDSYLQTWFFKEPKELQKVILSSIQHFPLKVWKPLINTSQSSSEMSAKERREMLLRIAQKFLESVQTKRRNK